MGLVGLLANLVAGVTVPARTAPTGYQDSLARVVLSPFAFRGQDTLYFGYARFAIALNSINRIVVEPRKNVKPEGGKRTLRHVSVNYGNFESSSLSAGLGVGFVTGRVDSGVVRAKLYLFGCWNFLGSKLPRVPLSLGAVLGTNLFGDKVFNDLIIGIRGGGISQAVPLGLIIGIDILNLRDKLTGHNVNGFVALDYRL